MEAAPYATVMSGSMWSFSSFPKYDLSISFTLVVDHDYMMSE